MDKHSIRLFLAWLSDVWEHRPLLSWLAYIALSIALSLVLREVSTVTPDDERRILHELMGYGENSVYYMFFDD